MSALRVAAGISYPLLIYAGLTLLEPAAFALLAGGGGAVHGLLAWRRGQLRQARHMVFPAALLLAVVLVAGLFNEGRAFLFVPVAVNGTLLIAFGRTLRHERSMVEVIARLQGYELSEAAGAYCRTVTIVWCLFFTTNGAVTLGLALYAGPAWWAFYTGFSYVLVGLLLLGEQVYRAWYFRRSEAAVTGPLLRRIFHRQADRSVSMQPATRYDAAVTAPEPLAEVVAPTFRELTLRVPENLGYLDGHFPDLPVVPAVVQIRWVMEAARPLLEEAPVVEHAEALKFRELLRPGDVFRLRVEVSAAAGTLDFRLWSGERVFSSGRWVFARRERAAG
jgi:uncharacterized membrane protein/3-hydroxymyristoyl/3-hydroxydecanoyl-(acyl carrier protein) dehydratase